MSYRKGKPILLSRGRSRIKRPKTFTSEDSARQYAEKQGLSSYKIVNMRISDGAKPKFKIVSK